MNKLPAPLPEEHKLHIFDVQRFLDNVAHWLTAHESTSYACAASFSKCNLDHAEQWIVDKYPTASANLTLDDCKALVFEDLAEYVFEQVEEFRYASLQR